MSKRLASRSGSFSGPGSRNAVLRNVWTSSWCGLTSFGVFSGRAPRSTSASEVGLGQEGEAAVECPADLGRVHPPGGLGLRHGDPRRAALPPGRGRAPERRVEGGPRGGLRRGRRAGAPGFRRRHRGFRLRAAERAEEPARGDHDGQDERGDQRPHETPALPPDDRRRRVRGVGPPPLRFGLVAQPAGHAPGARRRLLRCVGGPLHRLPQESLPLVVRHGRPVPPRPSPSPHPSPPLSCQLQDDRTAPESRPDHASSAAPRMLLGRSSAAPRPLLRRRRRPPRPPPAR